MTERTFVSSPHPIGRNAEWERLPIVGAGRPVRSRSRERLLVAFAGFVLGAAIVAVMVMVR